MRGFFVIKTIGFNYLLLMKIIISDKQFGKLKEARGRRPSDFTYTKPKECFVDLKDGMTIISGCNSKEVKDALNNSSKTVGVIFLNQNDFADFSDFPLESFSELESIDIINTKTNFEEIFPSDLYDKDETGVYVQYEISKAKPFQKTSLNLGSFLDRVKQQKKGETVYWDKISKKFYIKAGNENYMLNI